MKLSEAKHLPRKAKRKFWKAYWKKNKLAGSTRAERRQNWRAIWKELAIENRR